MFQFSPLVEHFLQQIAKPQQTGANLPLLVLDQNAKTPGATDTPDLFKVSVFLPAISSFVKAAGSYSDCWRLKKRWNGKVIYLSLQVLQDKKELAHQLEITQPSTSQSSQITLSTDFDAQVCFETQLQFWICGV